jgi:hypothetical protein
MIADREQQLVTLQSGLNQMAIEFRRSLTQFHEPLEASNLRLVSTFGHDKPFFEHLVIAPESRLLRPA